MYQSDVKVSEGIKQGDTIHFKFPDQSLEKNEQFITYGFCRKKKSLYFPNGDNKHIVECDSDSIPDVGFAITRLVADLSNLDYRLIKKEQDLIIYRFIKKKNKK